MIPLPTKCSSCTKPKKEGKYLYSGRALCAKHYKMLFPKFEEEK